MIEPLEILVGVKIMEKRKYTIYTKRKVYEGIITGQSLEIGLLGMKKSIVMENGTEYVRKRGILNGEYWKETLGIFDVKSIPIRNILNVEAHPLYR